MLVVERQFDLGHQIAALVIAEKRFRARRGEFHRPADFFRRPQHQAELDKSAIAGAEIAADVRRKHAQVFRRDTEHLNELVLLPHRAAGAGIERIAAGGGVVLAERRARLERHAGDSADMKILRHHMRGAGERLIGRLDIAEHGFHRDVIRHLVPKHRRAGPHRILGMQDERQFFVSHLDRFGGIHGLRLGHRHHHGDRFADMPHLVGRQERIGPTEHGAAAGTGQLHVEFGLRHRIVRDRRKLVGGAVGAGEHAEHARHRLRRRGIDRDNARMRIRRTHHHRIALAVEIEIVGETALAGDQPRIFLARHRLADEAVAGFVRSGFVVHLGSLAPGNWATSPTPPRAG